MIHKEYESVALRANDGTEIRLIGIGDTQVATVTVAGAAAWTGTVSEARTVWTRHNGSSTEWDEAVQHIDSTERRQAYDPYPVGDWFADLDDDEQEHDEAACADQNGDCACIAMPSV